MNKYQIGDLVWLHGGGWSNIPLIVVGYVNKHVEVFWHTGNSTLSFPEDMLRSKPQEK
jgi:hypothetical protein